jgi:hypothetical protein
MTTATPQYLTKTGYIDGLGCAKAIWLKFNRPEELPEVDAVKQQRFDNGKIVGEFAKSLFPNGIDIKEVDPRANDRTSRALIKKRKTLFEAGFIHRNGKCYARADILLPVTGGKWDILEVKSSTHVKDYHLHDVSFQKYCYESAGLKIRKCFVVHVNGEYVKDGEIDPNGFFVRPDVTEAVEQLMPDVPSQIKAILDITKRRQCPEFKHGEDYHKDEAGVHINDRIWKEHPDADILSLYRGGDTIIELFNAGILQIKDIPNKYELNGKQQIQQKAHSDNVHYIDHEQLGAFIERLKYPLYFLDFESYQTAIPLYDGLKPYQQIPFQFSVHITSKKARKPKHYSFIAEGSDDPRPAFARELKKVLGTRGSIVIYNQSFEQGIVRELAVLLPEYAEWANSTIERMVDLYAPFRSFAYYHPAQKGRASLKYVLPALTGTSYEGFEIANGSDASLAYLFITHGSYKGKKATPKEIRQTRKELEKYCGQDTEGLVKVLEKLEEFVGRKND